MLRQIRVPWMLALFTGIAAGVAFAVSCDNMSTCQAQSCPDVSTLTSQVSNLNSQVSNLNSQITALQTRVTTLETAEPKFMATTAGTADGGNVATLYNACKTQNYTDAANCIGACQTKCKNIQYTTGLFNSEYGATSLNCVCIKYQ